MLYHSFKEWHSFSPLKKYLLKNKRKKKRNIYWMLTECEEVYYTLGKQGVKFFKEFSLVKRLINEKIIAIISCNKK